MPVSVKAGGINKALESGKSDLGKVEDIANFGFLYKSLNSGPNIRIEASYFVHRLVVVFDRRAVT